MTRPGSCHGSRGSPGNFLSFPGLRVFTCHVEVAMGRPLQAPLGIKWDTFGVSRQG